MTGSEQKPRSGLQRGRLRLALAAGVILLAIAAGYLLNPVSADRQVTVHVDGRQQRLIVGRSATVGQALAQAGITLGPSDRVSPPLASAVTSSTISIVRVTTEERTRREAIPFNRLVTEDARCARGYRRIVQAGKAGLRELREMVIMEDGIEVERRTIGEQVIVQPIDEQVIVGSRDDPPLDTFRSVALAYLGRGGVTRLSPAVVEQTLFELARLQGDRYGSVRVLTCNGRPWLVVQSFAPAANDVALLVFWWSDELHSFDQIVSEGVYMLDGRAQQTTAGIELGLIVSSSQSGEASAPQYLLLRLPFDPSAQTLADTWQLLWSSLGVAEWRSSQGTVVFAGSGLERLDVRGASSAAGASSQSPFMDCRGCPRRRFASTWEHQGDAYVQVSQQVVASPYATLWAFADDLRSGNVTATLPLVADSSVISASIKAGLDRRDRQWTVSGRETDTTFDLRSKEASVRVTLTPGAQGWIVSGIGPVPATGRLLFTATRSVLRGIYQLEPGGSVEAIALGDGERYVWSSDYGSLAFDWQGQVYVMAGDGSNRRLIGRGVAPSWSPDGKRLALERQTDGGPLIVIVDVESGQETTLVAGSRPAWQPAHEGTTQHIAYAYTKNQDTPPAVYLIDVSGGAPALLASDGNEPLWSPDGTAVAFRTSRQEIAIVTLEPNQVRTVGQGWGYTWSPDGRWLAFIGRQPTGAPMLWQRSSGEVTPLGNRDDVDGLSWSPDGKELVLSVAGGGLWLVASDGSNLRKLADGRDPQWAWLPRAGR